MIIDRQSKTAGGETCPSVTLSATDLTWITLELTLGFRCEEAGDRPPTMRYSHCLSRLYLEAWEPVQDFA